MDNIAPQWISNAQIKSGTMVRFLGKLGRLFGNERGEVVIPFIDSVAEEQRPAVETFITNTGATNEDLAGFKTYDEFLSGYKPKAPSAPDWIGMLEPDHKALVGVKGWKTPSDTIKGYSELEKLVGHEKIAMPKKDKDGNWEKGEIERVMMQLGKPKDAKEYKESATFKLPANVPAGDKFTENFKVLAHKAGLLPHQYATMMDGFAEMTGQTLGAKKELDEKSYNESMLNLRAKWGLAYDQKAKLANAILANYSADPDKSAEIIKKYGNDPAIIELLANVGDNMSEESLARANMSATFLDPAAAKLEIAKINETRSKELMDATHPQHTYWVNKREEYYRMLG